MALKENAVWTSGEGLKEALWSSTSWKCVVVLLAHPHMEVLLGMAFRNPLL